MVRIISQNFSPQRSRHSSGETDTYLSERASSALGLSAVAKKRFECESSSDSFWESELDLEQDCEHQDVLNSEHGEDNNDINGNETLNKSSVQTKRKERRRERNKLSAQAYRQRRRSQNAKEQQLLEKLEARNKELHTIVETLERQTEQTKEFLRGSKVHMPDFLSTPASEAFSTGLETSAKAGPANALPETHNFSQPHHHDIHGATGASSSPHSTPPRTDTPVSPDPYRPQIASFTQQDRPTFSAREAQATNMNNNVFNSHANPQPPNMNSNTNNNINTTRASKTLLFPPTSSKLPTLPQQPTQVLVNANTLMQQPQYDQATAASNVPTFAVPVLMATPVEYSKASVNFNLNSTLAPPRGRKLVASPLSQNSLKPKNTKASANNNNMVSAPIVGTFLWSLDGSPPPAGPVYSLMSVQVCSNDNNANKNNTNSSVQANANSVPVNHNGNNWANSNMNNGASPSPPVTVNLNEVKVTGQPLQMWQHA